METIALVVMGVDILTTVVEVDVAMDVVEVPLTIRIPKSNLMSVDTTLLWIGTSSHSRNMIRFVKNAKRNQIRVGPASVTSVKSPLNMLPLSSGPCSRLHLPVRTLPIILMILCPSIPMLEMHSEARPMPRRAGLK